MAGVLDSRVRGFLDQGEYLFNQRKSLMALWQEIADHFYPERAQFTAQWWIGRNYADNLTTSYPLLCRRDLGNTFSQMLRPEDEEWFDMITSRPDRLDDNAKKWLEWATTGQRNAMYDNISGFVRSMNEADHDFATFGNDVTSCILNSKANALVYKCWHLRDCAWGENSDGIVDNVHRKWKPTIRDAVRLFGEKNVHPKLLEAREKEPFREFNARHMVIPIDQYEPPAGKRKPNQPFVSMFLDEENQHMMQEDGSHNLIYVVRRWQTVSGSQYAYSPCTIAALPDARLIQAFTLVLLEAGEKAVTPPMIAPADTIRSDIQLFAGGITTYDAEYDEKTGEVLRPIPVDFRSGLTVGIQMRQDVKEMISQAFFLNKIGLPPIGRDMTAFEVGQRVSEYVRNALPLFGPMANDNAKICELTFDVMFQAGGFGSPLMIPNSLRGQDIRFKFTTPLAQALEAHKGQQFLQAKQLLAEAAALDPACVAMLDARIGIRDALEGVGTPKKWLLSDQKMDKAAAAMQKKADLQQQMEMMGQGADVANKVGMAMQNTGMLPAPGQARRQGVNPGPSTAATGA